MKPQILEEIERIAGDHLTPEMREEIADRTMKIMEDHNRKVALAAIETVKQTMVQASEGSAAKEPNETFQVVPKR